MNIFIISYNRLSFLKQQIDFFSKNPDFKLHIVDNNSTYIPLLEYLSRSLHFVYSMPNNEGHKVVWSSGISKLISPDEPYIVTDNDIIPEDPDFHKLLLEGLEKFPSVNKIGLGLRIDDMPVDYPFKQHVLNHEGEVLKRQDVGDPRFIGMPVDTTLAIYRAGYHEYSVKGALRTTQSLAKHLSWYITEEDMKNEENKFYFESLKDGSTHWSYLQAKFGKPIKRKR